MYRSAASSRRPARSSSIAARISTRPGGVLTVTIAWPPPFQAPSRPIQPSPPGLPVPELESEEPAAGIVTIHHHVVVDVPPSSRGVQHPQHEDDGTTLLDLVSHGAIVSRDERGGEAALSRGEHEVYRKNSPSRRPRDRRRQLLLRNREPEPVEDDGKAARATLVVIEGTDRNVVEHACLGAGRPRRGREGHAADAGDTQQHEPRRERAPDGPIHAVRLDDRDYDRHANQDRQQDPDVVRHRARSLDLVQVGGEPGEILR